jgi:hypothetical protein
MWAQLRFGVADRIDDPDQVLEIYETAIPTTAAMGRIAEARRLAGEHVALAGRLTPHHRMHGVAIRVETEEAAGDWVAVRDLRPRIEEAVEANADTPCVRNARTLLVCAVAHEIEGDAAAARELERAAADVGFAEYDWALIAGRMRLAVVRGDRDAVHELLGARAYRNMSFGAAPVAVRMDALALVRDRERIEVEAPPLLQPRTLVQPFALRALGIARGDGALLTQADERFASLGLDWYRAQTEKLLSV